MVGGMLEIVTGVDIRYQGLFVRKDQRDACSCERRAQRSDACYAPLSFESRQDRVVCKTSNFQGFFPLQGPRGHSRLSQRPADLWESVRVWL